MTILNQIEVRQSPTDSSVVVKYPASWMHLIRGPRRDLDQILGDNPRAIFVNDGSMYESTAGHDMFLLFDPVENVNIPTKLPNEGLTLSVVNGLATGVYGGHMASGATVAVQTWPSLVRDGRAVYQTAGNNGERVWRIGIGATGDGRICVVMQVGSMSALADRMVAEGIVQGGYLDGGSSLAAEARGVFRRVHTQPAGSRIPGWIIAIPEGPPPTVESIGQNSPYNELPSENKKFVLPAILAAAALGFWWWQTEE